MAPKAGRKGMSHSTELWIGALRAVLMLDSIIILSPETVSLAETVFP
jgi:hypothetical protein